MNYSLILACDKNGIISIDGKIPWLDIRSEDQTPKYINDLRNFRAITLHHVIIMGSKTYESLPMRKLLNNRLNVVLSTREEIRNEVVSKGGLAYSNIAEMHKSLQKLKKEAFVGNNHKELLKSHIFVIGGIELYYSMKNLISKHYITVIPEECDSSSTSTIKYYNKDNICERYNSPFINNLVMDKMKFYIIPSGQDRPDNKYQNLMNRILQSNNFIEAEKDRTNFGYYALYGEQLKFDISDGKIPLTTLRAQPFRWIVEELLWFLNGNTDNKILKDKGVSIWTGNTTAEFLKKRKLNYPEGNAGPIYGFQWRHWGADYIAPDEKNNGIDQVAEVIKNLVNPANRYSRRHIISGWNVADLDKMVLPPCHVLYQFSVDSKDQIHTTFYQRSSDVALACSWNASSATILTNIIGCLTGLKPATLTMFIANAHIYSNHINGVKEMLNRKSYEFPTISITGINPIDHNNTDINKLLSSLKFEQFHLNDYFAHPDISLNMNP
jgi:thymidylate synthase